MGPTRQREECAWHDAGKGVDRGGEGMDDDLDDFDRTALIGEIKRLRAGIRAHRDSSGHDLCWHHPRLWSLLPEPTPRDVAVPPWPKFMAGCVAYRRSLDRELAGAPVADLEYDEDRGDG